MFNVFVDNRLVTVEKKYALIQLCSFISVHVPRFCYHNKLSVAANCRMCLIQLEDSLKPVAACAVPASHNMRIFTNTNLVKKARESVLELLLINHPLDCPICDQGGECDLQDQTIVFGSDRGRFFETKRAVKELFLGPVVKTFMSRCIHCTRCVRFSREILNSNELGLVGRGNNTRISTFINQTLKTYLGGNLADICPVGALTSKPFAFTARPWELKPYYSIDTFDGLGLNLRFDVRGSEIMRILPNIQTDDQISWISDKTRLYFDGLYRQRVSQLFLNLPAFTDKMVSVSWGQIFFFLLYQYSIFLSLLSTLNDLSFGVYSHNANFMLDYGSNTDADSIVQFNRFQNIFGSFAGLQFTFRSEFTCNDPLSILQNLKTKIFIGFTPENENPILASTLCSSARQVANTIVSYNLPAYSNFFQISGGISTFSLLKFIKGQAATCQFLLKPFMAHFEGLRLFVGGSFLSRGDYSQFKNCFNLLITPQLFLFYPNFFLLNAAQQHEAELSTLKSFKQIQ